MLTRREVLAGSAIVPLLGYARPTLAQPAALAFPREEAIAAFAEAARGQAGAMRRVGAVRGVVPPEDNETPTSIEAVAAILADRRAEHANPLNTALLFYQQTTGELRAWLIDQSGLRAASRQGVTAERLAQQAVDLRFWLNVDGRGISRAPVFRWRTAAPERIQAEVVDAPSLTAASQALAASLFSTELRRGLEGVEHLWVIGPGVVTALPLAMLPLGRRAMVVDRMSVTVAAGLYDLAKPVAPWSWAAAYSNPLIFGDPAVPPDPMAISVPPLAGARVEASRLGAMTRKAVQVGGDATKQLFLERWRSASTLYVAAHGVASADDPMEGSFLMLAGADPANGYLTARQILPRNFDRALVASNPNLRVNAALVVLSACQSGLGMQHEGGVIGLARSFQWRGAPRIVMSLWSVSDEATVTLMDHFNREAMASSPAVALRRAMLATRRRHPDPRLWAPFALFGAPR